MSGTYKSRGHSTNTRGVSHLWGRREWIARGKSGTYKTGGHGTYNTYEPGVSVTFGVEGYGSREAKVPEPGNLAVAVVHLAIVHLAIVGLRKFTIGGGGW